MARLCLDHSKSAKLRKTSRSRVFITEIQHKIAEDCRRSPAILKFFFSAGNAGDSNWSAVSCLFYAACAFLWRKIKNGYRRLTYAYCKRFESSMICFLTKALWSNDVHSFAIGLRKSLKRGDGGLSGRC